MPGQLGRCHCAASPIGPEPAEVLRGGDTAAPTLIRGSVEHTCPTAERVRRRPGPPAQGLSGARITISLPPELHARVVAAAGGPGRISDWARPLLEAGCETAEAASSPKKRR